MKKQVVALAAAVLAIAAPAFATPTVIYDSTPAVLPGNVPSLGYEATSTTEFGNAINFAGTNRALTQVNVVMSDWALQSTNTGFGDNTGYTWPLTFNIYAMGSGGAVGSLLGTNTINATIPWRPEADPQSNCGTAWADANGACWNGKAFVVTFNFTGLTLPDSVIYGLAYNTQHYGTAPTGASTPANSLNFGLSDTGASVGSDVAPGTAYWNTSFAGFYSDNGAGGVGTFRQDGAWAPYSGAVQFVADAGTVPEPGSLLLVGAALAGLAAARRRRNSQQG